MKRHITSQHKERKKIHSEAHHHKVSEPCGQRENSKASGQKKKKLLTRIFKKRNGFTCLTSKTGDKGEENSAFKILRLYYFQQRNLSTKWVGNIKTSSDLTDSSKTYLSCALFSRSHWRKHSTEIRNKPRKMYVRICVCVHMRVCTLPNLNPNPE